MRHPISDEVRAIGGATDTSGRGLLRHVVKQLAAWALYYSGLYFLYARFRDSWLPPRLVVVMYHRIRCGPRPAALTELERGVDIRRFREHVRVLAALGPLRTVRTAWAELRAGARRSRVAITFDDAYQDILPAVNYLRKRRHTCTVYAVVAASKQGKLLWWDKLYDKMRHLRREAEPVPWSDPRGGNQNGTVAEGPLYLNVGQLRELTRNGIEIGGHSVDHPFLSRVSRERLVQEINESRRFLELDVGIWPVSFAYPHGSWSNAAKEAVLRAGFTCAVTTRPGVVDRTDDASLLPRIPAGDEHASTLALRVLLWDMAKVWRTYRREGACLGHRYARKGNLGLNGKHRSNPQ